MKYLFAIVFLLAGCAHEDSTWQDRQSFAQDWMKRNHMEGTATCYLNTYSCDIVPADARAPFMVDCSFRQNGKGEKIGGCNLPRSLF